jgi:hypothetical protein
VSAAPFEEAAQMADRGFRNCGRQPVLFEEWKENKQSSTMTEKLLFSIRRPDLSAPRTNIGWSLRYSYLVGTYRIAFGLQGDAKSTTKRKCPTEQESVA